MPTKSSEFSTALGETLKQKELLKPNELTRALALCASEQIPLDRAILKLGFLEETEVLQSTANILSWPYFDDVTSIKIDEVRLAELTPEYCSDAALVPIISDQSKRHIVLSDPSSTQLQDEVKFHLEEEVSFAVAPLRTIRALLSSNTNDPIIEEPTLSEELLQADKEQFKRENFDGPTIRFVNEVIQEAVAIGASDIHFETQADGLRIRVRKNGVLQVQPVANELAPSSILARLKVLASMNVSERRLPQDGRISLNISGRKVDFRVSSVPTSFGESIVCRILDPTALRLGWAKLGFEEEIIQQIISAIEQPNGLFLVTGPTGSGKTTTLYTALSHLNNDERKILTIEDPIEYNLDGIEQVQVHEEIGMTFATALRSFLRQDPNVIMVGEIRDKETAEIACRAALVGRMVLSTLHTNSPEGAVTRLVDLGVPIYIVEDVLRGVLGQKLEITKEKKQRLFARFI